MKKICAIAVMLPVICSYGIAYPTNFSDMDNFTTEIKTSISYTNLSDKPAFVNGTNGVNGVNGVNGTNGAQGIQGVAGTNGSNATATTNAADLTTGTLPDARLRYVALGFSSNAASATEAMFVTSASLTNKTPSTNITGTITAGIATTATNTVTLAATGWTNTLGVNARVSLSLATTSALHETNGTLYWTIGAVAATTRRMIVMSPLERLIGTGITGTARP
jgi:hypothetical protein